MKKYRFQIMSIDPDDNSEDNHQKYGCFASGNDIKDAEKKAIEEFTSKYRLPIYWIKCVGEIDENGNLL